MAAAALLLAVLPLSAEDEFMPAWHEGYLDIHSLSTGRGDCTFVVMPDGTTMLIDAGDVGPGWHVAQPNPSKTPGEWIAKYIHDFSENLPHRDTVDYFYLTHYHGDHIGVKSQVRGHNHGYGLCGITRVGEDIHFNRIIDRDCPDYNYPSREYITKESFFKDYIKFVEYQRDSCGTIVEKFKVGSRKQFSPQYDRKSYRKNFEVYNIAANGYIHTGKGMKTRFMYDEDPNGFDENMNSGVILMKYGKFTYYNGGDIGGGPHPSFKTKHRDAESQIADLIGGHVTMIKPDHHGWQESSNGYFLKILSPELIVEMCSNRSHPYYATLARLADPMSYDGPRKFFITTEGSRGRIEATEDRLAGRNESGKDPNGYFNDYRYPELWKNFVPYYGHVVVRVYEGGTKYQVFVLDSKVPDYHILYKTEIEECR